MELVLKLQPKQREAIRSSAHQPMFLFGGAKGGGKSHVLRARELYRRLKYPQTKGLIVRKSYPELLSNHIRKFFVEYPETRTWYTKAEKIITYPNGSITEFSYLGSPDDAYTYQGRDYDDISIDEVTQHEEETIKLLWSSNRISNPDARSALPENQQITPTMFLTGNPGGIGHQYIKRVFIDRNYQEGEDPGDYAFLPAFVADNKKLTSADPNYVKRLLSLPEHLKRAYLDGDWDVFAGRMFEMVSRQTHLVDDFPLPAGTKFTAGFDPGFIHPYGFVLIAHTPEGTSYVCGYATKQKSFSVQTAEIIKKALPSPIPIHAGHDLWYPGRGGGKSMHEELAGEGLVFTRAKVDRKQGVVVLREALRLQEDGKPQLFFFRSCLPVFEQVVAMQGNPRDPEDVLKVDANEYGLGGDDLYDAFRYAMMGRVRPVAPTANTARDELLAGIKKREYIRRMGDLQ